MPENDAELQAEGGKRVTITIAEMSGEEASGIVSIGPGDDPNNFIISNGKYRLTITIAE